MTDSRLPDYWLGNPNMEKLSAEAWRLFTGALMYSNRYGTDGKIERTDLHHCHPAGDRPDLAQELVTAGLWEVGVSYFQHVDWPKTQSPTARVEQGRESGRIRQQAYRDRLRTEQETKDAAALRRLEKKAEREAARNALRDASPPMALPPRLGEARSSPALEGVRFEIDPLETFAEDIAEQRRNLGSRS